jgi:hypothetical protein
MPTSRRAHSLVVVDDPLALDVLRGLLKQYGYRVERFSRAA